MKPAPSQYVQHAPPRLVELRAGLVLRRGATVFRIHEIGMESTILGRRFILEHALTQERKAEWEFTLLGLIGRGDVVIATDESMARASQGDLFTNDDLWISKLRVDELTTAQVDHAVRTLKYINALRARGHTNLRPSPILKLELEAVARGLGETSPISLSKLYDWSRKLDRADGDPLAVVPAFQSRGGSGASRLTPKANAAIAAELADLERQPNARIVVSHIVRGVQDRLIKEHGAEVAAAEAPTWSTVDRRTKRHFGAFAIMCRNRGRQFAEKKFGKAFPREPYGFPLACVEFDDKDTRQYLVDERSSLPYGRVLLTVGIDQHTEYVLGWELSIRPRSTHSAVAALVACMLPKDPEDPQFADCRGMLEGSGRPALVLMDNAMYNHAKNMMHMIVGNVQAIAAHARGYTPRDKSAIERFNGRIETEFLPSLESYTGPKAYKDRHRNPIDAAVYGLQAFRAKFAQWVVDCYLNQPLPDGLSPRQRWIQGMKDRKTYVPTDATQLRLLSYERQCVRFRPEGICFRGLHWSSEELHQLRRYLGSNAEVELRLNPDMLGEVFVVDPRHKGHLLRVPSTQPEYVKNLTLYQHGLIRKLATQARDKNPSNERLFEYRQALRVQTEQLRHSKKLVDRKKAARAGGSGAEPAKEPANAEPVSALEKAMDELDSVQMDANEDGWGNE